ncbi:MAG: SLBB domain-containing protein, partial [Campylobacterota bacterium]|nr:SLBB domain-containing protein [Campylobacterota bacterium]
MQKYEQYKSLIDDKNIDQKSAKEIKTEVAVNNIKATNGEVKATVKNLFKYGYENIKLNRYGQSFFQNKNILNNTLIPTSNNYILNNGDTIYINTYGTKNTKTYELKIDNNGNINIPDIGLLKVASLSFAEAKTVVTNTITKAFPRTKVIVDISGYSSIQVVVTGNVKVPGIYNLSSFSTIKDALINANGLLEVGSYRDINVVRNGKKIYTFDLYKLLTSADKQNDILLRSGDIITVNFTKKSLTLTGKVKNQAIYELKDKESFQDLLRYSGGFSYDATKNSIKLTRYDENQKLQTLILSKNKLFSMTPKDGDKIEVFNNYEIKEKPYVYVHGKVVKDDSVKYKYFEGMNLKELYTMVTFRSEIY